jgi:hydroxyacylglutathione hydrolase
MSENLLETASLAVVPVPALEDNYMYIIMDKATRAAAVVDPVEPQKVLEVAREIGVKKMQMVLTTHNHWDHAGGNGELAKNISGIEIIGGKGDRVPACTREVGQDDSFSIGSLKCTVIFTPFHTTGHVCYIVQGGPDEPAYAFTGDCLFVGGCGHFFCTQMTTEFRDSFVKLAALPGDTRVLCGHEYTEANLDYAAFVEPFNEAIKAKRRWAKQQSCTMPSTIASELDTNPFMRAAIGNKALMTHCQPCTSTVDAVVHVRKEKSAGAYKSTIPPIS